MNEQKDFQEILRGVSLHAMSQLNAENCLILMVNPRTRETVKTLQKDVSKKLQQGYRVLQNLVSGWIMVNNQSFLSADITKDHRYDQSKFDNLKVKSVLGIALRVEGVLLGTILLLNKNESQCFNEIDLAYLEKVGVIAAPYLRNTQKIQQYFESALPESSLIAKYANLGVLGKSQKHIEILKAVEAAANSDVRVLLEGPSGTGKELIARAIHKFSPRQGRFVAIDCGAIPENMLESELFGHVKGAFTGANSERKGLIEEASGGTLFMDEIANLPLPMQVKLMRVLQESEIRPVGSNKTRAVDVRIIAASSASLRELVATGKFREDLFFRLHVYPIIIAPLRDRQEDIPLLANHFMQIFSQKQKKQLTGFQDEVLEFIRHAQWPGNIRELENFVERLVTLASAETTTIDATLFPSDLSVELEEFRLKSWRYVRESLKNQVQRFEAKIIRQTLEKCGWNQSRAARELQTSEKNIRYKIQTLNINKSAEK